MGIRKYLFWKNNEGIRSYKVTQKGTFELMKPSGNDVFTDGEWEDFFIWFNKNAAITEDEYIDFCFLSEDRIDSPLLVYNYSKKSSWDKKEVTLFCEKFIHEDTYEIVYSEDKSFICQNSNISDKGIIKKMFLKCIPEFSDETKEIIETGSVETSIVNRYFIDKLNEIKKK